MTCATLIFADMKMKILFDNDAVIVFKIYTVRGKPKNIKEKGCVNEAMLSSSCIESLVA